MLGNQDLRLDFEKLEAAFRSSKGDLFAQRLAASTGGSSCRRKNLKIPSNPRLFVPTALATSTGGSSWCRKNLIPLNLCRRKNFKSSSNRRLLVQLKRPQIFIPKNPSNFHQIKDLGTCVIGRFGSLQCTIKFGHISPKCSVPLPRNSETFSPSVCCQICHEIRRHFAQAFGSGNDWSWCRVFKVSKMTRNGRKRHQNGLLF